MHVARRGAGIAIMATWDGETTPQSRDRTLPAPTPAWQFPHLLAAGLLVFMISSGPYYALRNALSETPLATAGPSDVSVSTSASWGGAVVVKPRQAQAVPLLKAGQFVVAFGRFQRQESAEAHARLVRSKGYVAKVVRSGAAYVVVSRPYRSLSDARFWSKVFGELGLEARALARLEAQGPQASILTL